MMLRNDFALFEVAVQGGHFLQALALWRGPLADGLATDDMPEVDHWLTGERSRMHGLWRHALQSQAQALSTLEPDRALAHWHRLLADDPLQEQHHQAVMRLYLAQGRREEVLAQHRRCVQLLREELGLTPSADTDALAKQALAAASAEKGAPNTFSGTSFQARKADMAVL
jgi:DNA-binding SARP family transcriptional activator